jgi:hypothetical protein
LRRDIAMARPSRQFRVLDACTQSWETMTGTAAERHCQSCDKVVHNFAAMTPRAIEQVLAEHEGHLCARIVRRLDGSVVTARSATHPSRAASLLVGITLSAGAALAEQPGPKAIVSGSIRATQGKALSTPGQVLFVANGEPILQTTTDASGFWTAELAPGTYDVVFRNGPLMGERVNSVQLHSGEQSFSTITEHFAFGHLEAVDKSTEDMTTMGEVVATYRYPVKYFFKHPLRYLRHLPHNFS